MTNAELIMSLRYCFEKKTVLGVPWYVWCDRAADALEAAEKRIVKLNTKCADLQSHINSMESEIEELLPKEGESIDLSEKYALLENGDIEPLQYEDCMEGNAYRDWDGLYYLDHDARVEFGSIYGYAYLHDRIVKTSDTKAVLMSTRLYAEKHHPEILKGEQE